jgi:RIO kinase 1
MLSMRYLGGEQPAPRLQDVELEDPLAFAERTVDAVRQLALAGVVHTDLSPFNVLVHDLRPWVIDLSQALRVDRTGYSPWQRLASAEQNLTRAMRALSAHFSKYRVSIQVEPFVKEVVRSLDRFGVMP